LRGGRALNRFFSGEWLASRRSEQPLELGHFTIPRRRGRSGWRRGRRRAKGRGRLRPRRWGSERRNCRLRRRGRRAEWGSGRSRSGGEGGGCLWRRSEHRGRGGGRWRIQERCGAGRRRRSAEQARKLTRPLLWLLAGSLLERRRLLRWRGGRLGWSNRWRRRRRRLLGGEVIEQPGELTWPLRWLRRALPDGHCAVRDDFGGPAPAARFHRLRHCFLPMGRGMALHRRPGRSLWWEGRWWRRLGRRGRRRRHKRGLRARDGE